MLRSSRTVIVLLLLVGGRSYAGSGWLCEEEASQRRENEFRSCGIGEGHSENDARLQALENAKKEFEQLCVTSDDCKGHKVSVDPRRTECQKAKDGFVCHRLVAFVVDIAMRDESPRMARSPTAESVASTSQSSTNPTTSATETKGIPSDVAFNFDHCTLRTVKPGLVVSDEEYDSGAYRLVCSFSGKWAKYYQGYLYLCKMNPNDGSPIFEYTAIWKQGYRAPYMYAEDDPKKPVVTCDLSNRTCTSGQLVYSLEQANSSPEAMNSASASCTGKYEASNFRDFENEAAAKWNKVAIAPIPAQLRGTYRMYAQAYDQSAESRVKKSDGMAYYAYLDVGESTITQRISPPPALVKGHKNCEIYTRYRELRILGDQVKPKIEETLSIGCGSKEPPVGAQSPQVFCLSRYDDLVTLTQGCDGPNIGAKYIYKLEPSGAGKKHAESKRVIGSQTKN